MTLTDARIAASSEPQVSEALIREARTRQRRRYSVVAVALVVATAGVWIGVGFSGSTGGRVSSDWKHPSAGAFGDVPPPLTVTQPPRIGVLGIDPGPLGNEGTIYTWSGLKYSTLRAPSGLTLQNYSTVLSPNGTSVLAYSIRGESLSVLSSRQVHTRSSYSLGGAIWSDDSRHLCSLKAVSTGTPWLVHPAELVLTTVGQGSRNVAKVFGGADHGGTQLVACDVSAHVAILAVIFMGTVTAMTYVNLHTGSQWTAPWYNYAMGTVQVSGNGEYAATGGGSLGGGKVISTSSGDVVGHFPGQSLGISWLGHNVLVLNDNLEVPQVYDWQTGKVLWTAPGFGGPCPCYGPELASTARPGTDELALNVSHGETEAQFQHHDEYLKATLWFVTRMRSWIVSRDVAPG